MVIKLYSYELKTISPKWPIREGIVIETPNGWGEIAPLPDFSSETLEEAKTLDLKLPSVQFGLSSAARPFDCRPLKIPLGLLNNPRPGFSHLKLKIGHLGIDEAVKHVKKFVGLYKLRLDFNRSWTLDQALSFASHFSPHDFEYLEEPVSTFPELLAFSELTSFPIALDESLAKFPWQDIPTFVAAVVKPSINSPLSKFPVPVVLSSAYESSLGLLQIARLYEKGNPPPGLDTFRFFYEDLLVPPLKAENGFLTWEGTDGCPIDRSKLCAL